MKRTAFLVFLAAITVFGMIIAYRLSPPSHAALAAADQLKTARMVCFGGGGISGQITGEEDCLFVILASHRAEGLLAEVFDAGTPEAKTYALCGLHYIVPASFERYARQFAAANARVRTLSGCIGGARDSAEMVAKLRDNFFESYLPLRQKEERRRQEVEMRSQQANPKQ